MALESSLTDDTIREKCCNALLVLGGRFSLSGKVMIEDWVLKKAGFIDCHEPQLLDSKEDVLPANCTLSVCSFSYAVFNHLVLFKYIYTWIKFLYFFYIHGTISQVYGLSY